MLTNLEEHNELANQNVLWVHAYQVSQLIDLALFHSLIY